MNTTEVINIRIPKDEKQKFLRNTKRRGFSMSLVLTEFVKRYNQNPESIRLEIDESHFDNLWKTEDVGEAMSKLNTLLKKK